MIRVGIPNGSVRLPRPLAETDGVPEAKARRRSASATYDAKIVFGVVGYPPSGRGWRATEARETLRALSYKYRASRPRGPSPRVRPAGGRSRRGAASYASPFVPRRAEVGDEVRGTECMRGSGHGAVRRTLRPERALTTAARGTGSSGKVRGSGAKPGTTGQRGRPLRPQPRKIARDVAPRERSLPAYSARPPPKFRAPTVGGEISAASEDADGRVGAGRP